MCCDYNEDNETGSVLLMVVQASGIKDELIQGAEILPKFSCEGFKPIAKYVLQYPESLMLTALDHREKLSSWRMRSKMSDICTTDEFFRTEMKATTIFCMSRNRAEEKYIFYVQSTQRVMKRPLLIAKPHQIQTFHTVRRRC